MLLINNLITHKTCRFKSSSLYMQQQQLVAAAGQELIWRKGTERCERSYKNPALTKDQQQYIPQMTSLIQRVSEPSETENFRQISSKREDVNTKINSRYLVGQSTQNPFMPANNYVNDIEVQLTFLTPQKS